MTEPPSPPPDAPGEGDAPDRPRAPRRIQHALYLLVTLGVLVGLLWPSGRRAQRKAEPPRERPVSLLPSGQIRIATDSTFFKKLQLAKVETRTLAVPVLTVTGTVVASLRPAKAGARDWQFSSPELLSTYTDWRKALADIAFARTQLEAIRQLADTRIAAQETLEERLRRLVEAGTEAEKDLVTARTELLQSRIARRKELHEAEMAWRLAQRTEAALRRQLEQAGVDPEMLRVSSEQADIVVADVPEGLAPRVKVGQGCEARFVGVAGKTFKGQVHALSPVLSQERRSLRVLFTLQDPDDLLRPGMFADIGLGTDSRPARLAPLAGVVHVGRADYMLVRTADGDWRPTEVQVGEAEGELVEILGGLEAEEQVLGQGAILLKPLLLEALRRPRVREAG